MAQARVFDPYGSVLPPTVGPLSQNAPSVAQVCDAKAKDKSQQAWRVGRTMPKRERTSHRRPRRGLERVRCRKRREGWRINWVMINWVMINWSTTLIKNKHL